MFWRASVEFPYYIAKNPSCNTAHNSFLCTWLSDFPSCPPFFGLPLPECQCFKQLSGLERGFERIGWITNYVKACIKFTLEFHNQRLQPRKYPFLKVGVFFTDRLGHNSYLWSWTYDLYGPVSSAFDAGKSITRVCGRGLGPGNRYFFLALWNGN